MLKYGLSESFTALENAGKGLQQCCVRQVDAFHPSSRGGTAKDCEGRLNQPVTSSANLRVMNGEFRPLPGHMQDPQVDEIH